MPQEPQASSAPSASADTPLHATAVREDLLSASRDLERLQTLLADACDTLMQSFHGANERLAALHRSTHSSAVADAAYELGQAVTALQFQDMASQLIAHTGSRLRACAQRIAREDAGDATRALAAEPPLRPNPVTQDEMDAGSVELF